MVSLRGAQRRSDLGHVVRANFDRDCFVAMLLAMTWVGFASLPILP